MTIALPLGHQRQDGRSLLTAVFSSKPVLLGSYWEGRGHDLSNPPSTSVLFPFDQSLSRIALRLSIHATGTSGQSISTRDNSTDPVVEVNAGIFGFNYPVRLYLSEGETGNPCPTKTKESRRNNGASAAINETLLAHPHFLEQILSLGIDPATLISSMEVRGMLVVRVPANDTSHGVAAEFVRVDDRHLAAMCENPNLIGRLACKRSIEVDVAIAEGHSMRLTLVPDTGFVPSGKK